MVTKQYRAFLSQRGKARQRGIRFRFTYEQWSVWWEDHLGQTWFDKRGRKRGQFVMARKGDKGPYAPWNVLCVLNSVNAFHKVELGSVAGEKSPMAKLSEKDVVYIRTSGKKPKALALEFPHLRKETIVQARNGRSWTCLNDRYPPVKDFIKRR